MQDWGSEQSIHQRSSCSLSLSSSRELIAILSESGLLLSSPSLPSLSLSLFLILFRYRYKKKVNPFLPFFLLSSSQVERPERGEREGGGGGSGEDAGHCSVETGGESSGDEGLCRAAGRSA
jgi:hypothetical protein